MWAFKRYMLNVNWQLSFAIGIIGMQILGLVYLLTIYVGIFRNGWWIVFTSQDQELACVLLRFAFCVNLSASELAYVLLLFAI